MKWAPHIIRMSMIEKGRDEGEPVGQSAVKHRQIIRPPEHRMHDVQRDEIQHPDSKT
jgi:hypothetical protein